jgi:hypothetical protein
MSLELVAFAEEHVAGVPELYEAEGWPSLSQDPALARRAASSRSSPSKTPKSSAARDF